MTVGGKQDEWLEYTCRNCGYAWRTPCMDAETPHDGETECEHGIPASAFVDGTPDAPKSTTIDVATMGTLTFTRDDGTSAEITWLRDHSLIIRTPQPTQPIEIQKGKSESGDSFVYLFGALQ